MFLSIYLWMRSRDYGKTIFRRRIVTPIAPKPINIAATGGRLRDIFDREPGPRILANSIALDNFEDGQFTEIFRADKDRWPMRLAQFGTFQFPAGTMPADRFFAYGQALKGQDGHCLLFKR